MAFSTEIVHIIASTDTVLRKVPEVIQNVAASTNQYDMEITFAICLTVLGVCLFVCLAVIVCFIVVSRIKRHAKEKDHLVEIKKLEINEELIRLRLYKEDKDGEEKKEKKKEESKLAEQNQMNLVEKVKDLMKTGANIKITLKSGSESIEVTSQNAACPIDVNKKS